MERHGSLTALAMAVPPKSVLKHSMNRAFWLSYLVFCGFLIVFCVGVAVT